MVLKLNSTDEWTAAAKGLLLAIAERVPGIAEALGAYDGFEQRRKEKVLAQFAQDVTERLDQTQPRLDSHWFASEEGLEFTAKVLDAVLNAQMSEKRQFFANALLHGGSSDLSLTMKHKFVDLLRTLSRSALDVLAELHREFGAVVTKPVHERSKSTFITAQRVAETICSGTDHDPYFVMSAVEELRSAGLFSQVQRWVRHDDGRITANSSYSGDGFGYTEFTATFVRFITDPER